MKNLSQNDIGMAVAFFASAVAVGAWSWASGSPGWAVLAVILLGMGFVTLMTRRHPCPGCGAPVKFEFRRSIARCEPCHDYFQLREGKAEQVAVGTIADRPVFSARLEDIKPPSEWAWPDPGLCVVCRKPTDRRGKLGVSIVDQGLVVSKGVKWNFEIADCGGHEDGVTWASETASVAGREGARDEHPLGLQFRAYDSWRAFERLNARPQTKENVKA